MKTIPTLILSLLASTLHAQQDSLKQLPKIYINENVSTHFVCSEPISFVDLSNKKVEGDMPMVNILRVHPSEKFFGDISTSFGIATIVCQKYMVQYELVYTSADKADKSKFIASEDGKSLLNPEITLSNDEMKDFAKRVIKEKSAYWSVRNLAYRMESRLNNVVTIGDYYFIDVTFKNRTNIKYDIDQFRFKIEDKKLTKATNVQSLEIQPVFSLYNAKEFKKTHRNVFVFKKFTYPEEKAFTVEMAEVQISGRRILLRLDYSDVLNADTLN